MNHRNNVNHRTNVYAHVHVIACTVVVVVVAWSTLSLGNVSVACIQYRQWDCTATKLSQPQHLQRAVRISHCSTSNVRSQSVLKSCTYATSKWANDKMPSSVSLPEQDLAWARVTWNLDIDWRKRYLSQTCPTTHSASALPCLSAASLRHRQHVLLPAI